MPPPPPQIQVRLEKVIGAHSIACCAFGGSEIIRHKSERLEMRS